jgi:hypothetical protein
MSLAPKIDEVRSVAAEVNLDIICIVESWLQTHIHDNIVHIDNYNIKDGTDPQVNMAEFVRISERQSNLKL